MIAVAGSRGGAGGTLTSPRPSRWRRVALVEDGALRLSLPVPSDGGLSVDGTSTTVPLDDAGRGAIPQSSQ
jgi:hypothetical protein